MIMILLWISIPELPLLYRTPTKFRLDPLTPSKVIVSTARIHVRMYVQTDSQTDGRTEFFLVV